MFDGARRKRLTITSVPVTVRAAAHHLLTIRELSWGVRRRAAIDRIRFVLFGHGRDVVVGAISTGLILTLLSIKVRLKCFYGRVYFDDDQ